MTPFAWPPDLGQRGVRGRARGLDGGGCRQRLVDRGHHSPLGLLVATIAGLIYAVWPPAALSEVTVRLEPMTSLGLLLALALLFGGKRRPLS